MIEINRWNKDSDGNLIPNPEFVAILNTKRIGRSPLLECSGRYDNCRLYNGKVYEVWINWGYDHVFELQRNDNYNTHQDREGRVGETYAVDRCQTGTELIERNVGDETS